MLLFWMSTEWIISTTIVREFTEVSYCWFLVEIFYLFLFFLNLI